jgi:hypothetical protein
LELTQPGTKHNKKYALRPLDLAFGKRGIAALRIFLKRYTHFKNYFSGGIMVIGFQKGINPIFFYL